MHTAASTYAFHYGLIFRTEDSRKRVTGGTKMKKIGTITAITLSSALLLSGMSAGAYYGSSDEIALDLRGMSGGNGVYMTADDVNTIYVSPSAAAEGTTVHFGIFIESDKAELIVMSIKLESAKEQVTFLEDTFVEPKAAVFSEAQTYTLPDGTEFQSKYVPYCLGKINSMNVYSPDAMSANFNFSKSENALYSTWMHGTENATSFLGGRSDAYSYAEFDVSIAPGTEPGEYPIYFVKDDTVEISQSPTHISSYDYLDGTGKYYHVIPELIGSDIIVGSYETAETAMPVFRFAEDTTPFSTDDLSTEVLHYTADGTQETVSADQLSMTTTYESPASVNITELQQIRIPLSCQDEQVMNASGEQAELVYEIGKRGDVNGNGMIETGDAAAILQYIAQEGAGQNASLTDGTETEEAFAVFLADVNAEEGTEEHKLDTADASCILTYIAAEGAGRKPDWDDILHPSAFHPSDNETPIEH